MRITHPAIFAATEKSEYTKTTLWKSIRDLDLKLEFKIKENNEEPLPVIYNQAIDAALSTDVDCLILVHDDVQLKENPIPMLEQMFDTYDLVGVAGTDTIKLESPALWHLMGGGFGGGHLHGCVDHKVQELYSSWTNTTNFGPVPHQAVMIDGVFMVLSRKIMENLRFDETNPAKFHFYDLSYSLSAHLAGFKVGVADIRILHESPGLREFTEEWKMGEQWFLNTYGQ